MASKQNRNMQGKNTSKRKSGKQVEQKKKSFRDELIFLFVIGISLLLFLGNFGLAGVGDSGGNWLSYRLFGFFGIIQYLLPVWLVFSAFLIFKYRNRTGIYKKIALLFIIQLIIDIIIELLHGKNNMGQTFWNYFENGKEHFFTGGAIGGWFANLIYGVFGILASVLILILVMIGCMVLLTEKSFVKGVEKQSRRIYETTKEEMRQRRIQAEQSKSELQDLHVQEDVMEGRQDHRRKETVFRGMSKVTLDVPKKKRMPANTGDIHEIFSEESQDGVIGDKMSIQNSSITIHRSSSAGELAYSDSDDLSGGLESINHGGEEVGEDIPVVKRRSSNRPKKENNQLTKEEQGAIEQEIERNVGQLSHSFQIPPLELLKMGAKPVQESDAYLKKIGLKLQQTLQSFGVNVTVTNISCGPTVTRYELQPEQGVKVSRIVNLADDIKLNLAVADIRIEAPIPGKAAVGIEVPNRENSTVLLRELLESAEFSNSVSPITFAVGKDIAGKVIVADIARMPHLLIAGATGAGKSVCINTLIMSILYKADPNKVKLLMIDPKVVELSVYNGIPHLCHPVETDPKKAAGALNWAVGEMTRRYKLFADFNVRDLKGYNKKIERLPEGEDRPLPMPHIVIIVDELADLMMVSKNEVEDSICRLAQLARAAGIHLIIATQRPSVDVITGLIKANMPSRIAFAVSSGVDSRTIIDMNGAEKLLGKGDMLFYPSGYPKPVRVQGAFVSDREVSDVVNFLKENNQEAEYNQEIEQHVSSVQAITSQDSAATGMNGYDELFVEAGKFIIEKDKGSIGMLQRVFRIGFNRAARIMDQLEEAGVVGGEEGTKARTVLMSMEQFEQYIEESV